MIPCELGAGKSTAAKVWCAVNETRPGVLVVVRTKDQADEYARDINAWSGVPGSPSRTTQGSHWPSAKTWTLGVLPGAGGVSQII